MFSNNISFCASQREIRSIRNACKRMANDPYKEREYKIETDGHTDLAYLSTITNSLGDTVRLTLENNHGGCAFTTLKRGKLKDCLSYIAKESSINDIAKTLDELKELLRKAEERENTRF